MIPRRTLFASGGSLLLLSACTQNISPASAAAYAADANLIVSALASVVNAIAATPGVDPAKLQQLESYLTTLQGEATAISAAAQAATSAASNVQKIASVVQALAPLALALVPRGSALIPVINAAVSMLPAVLAAAGVAGAEGALSPKYTPDEARIILIAATR